MKKLVIASAVAASLGLAAGNAAASVYGHSMLFTQNLVVTFGDPTEVSVTNFNFDTTNTAALNSVGGSNFGNCAGTPLSNTCAKVGPPANALVYNAPGSAPLQGENAFALQGPGADQYSWSDSVIDSAELVNFVPTNTRQASEAELQSGFQASGNTNIQSTTVLAFNFVVGEDGNTLSLTFNADPTLQAAIAGEPPGTYTAQANMAVTFNLTNDETGDFVIWRPNGDLDATDCAAVGGGLGCVEFADAENLNDTVNTGTNGTSDDYSLGAGFGAYEIRITGLSAGRWSLALREETSVALSRNVPVPGTLLLLGAGMLGLATRRKRRS
jgi:hypothetical protein